MTLFQLLLLATFGGLFLVTLGGMARGRITRRWGLASLGLWLVACGSVIWPDFTSRVAHLVGIGRGADLVLYCALVFMMVGFFVVYVRLRRLRSHITVLVREMAIMRAEGPLADPEDRRRNGSEPTMANGRTGRTAETHVG